MHHSHKACASCGVSSSHPTDESDCCHVVQPEKDGHVAFSFRKHCTTSKHAPQPVLEASEVIVMLRTHGRRGACSSVVGLGIPTNVGPVALPLTGEA